MEVKTESAVLTGFEGEGTGKRSGEVHWGEIMLCHRCIMTKYQVIFLIGFSTLIKGARYILRRSVRYQSGGYLGSEVEVFGRRVFFRVG